MTLLQQQGSSTHNSSHVNQIGTMTGSSHVLTGNVSSISCSMSKAGESEWILDSCATDHVTSSSHLYSSCRQISPIIVKLPTGHTVTATYAGTIRFSRSLYLEDVLCIPSFQFNLISISKLLCYFPCKLTFVVDTCFIHDVQTLQRIGTVDLVDGLYKLNMKKSDFFFVTAYVSYNSSTYSCNKVPINIWHFQLVHPSFKRLQLLKQSHPLLSVDKQFVCPTCHHAKQRKNS